MFNPEMMKKYSEVGVKVQQLPSPHISCQVLGVMLALEPWCREPLALEPLALALALAP